MCAEFHSLITGLVKGGGVISLGENYQYKLKQRNTGFDRLSTLTVVHTRYSQIYFKKYLPPPHPQKAGQLSHLLSQCTAFEMKLTIPCRKIVKQIVSEWTLQIIDVDSFNVYIIFVSAMETLQVLC
jgi:hypothetical protein